MVKRLKYCFLVVSLLIACKTAQLQLIKVDDLPNTFRLDGYYINEVVLDNDVYYKFYFLYTNGVLYGGTHLLQEKLNTVEEKVALYEIRNRATNMRDLWGAFRIYDKKIEFEKWEPSSGGPMKTVIRQGDILNDTTFVIRKRINNYDGKTYLVQDTFRFRQFSPKPDSTNRFVK